MIKAALPDSALRVLEPPYLKLQWRIHLLKDWWGTKVWTRTKEVVTPLGFKLTSGFHPAYAMMRRGTFEPAETALLTSLMDDLDVFVDVGANLGYYSLLALQNGKVIVACEPQPQNLRALLQNLMANGWEDGAEVFPVALSDRPGLLSLFGASGPSASLVKDWAGYSSLHRQVVPVSTLDNVLGRRFAGKRLFVKIDVEGAEHQVLQGALATLAMEPKPLWLVEICLNEFHPEGMNPDFAAIFELFFSNGYQAFTATTPPRAVTLDEVRGWIAAGGATSETFNYLFRPAA